MEINVKFKGTAKETGECEESYAYLINTGIKYLSETSVRLMERFLVLTYT